MQISGMAARLLESKQRVFVQIDFLPEFSDSAFSDEIERRMREDRSQMLGDLFLGLVHKKILDLLLAEKGLQAEMKARRIDDAGIRQILQSMREYTLEVIQVKSFKQAQVTSGGILLEDTDADFQSRLQPGLFFAGGPRRGRSMRRLQFTVGFCHRLYCRPCSGTLHRRV